MSTETILATSNAVSVGMGQAFSARSGQTLTAVLGSCVGVVLYHPRLNAAAMAHVVLPHAGDRVGPPGKFADTAIAELMRLMVAAGAGGPGVVSKIAGGANMFGTVSGPMQIGEQNIQACREALSKANIRILAEHLGGKHGRRVRFFPQNGELQIDCAGTASITI